MTRGKIAVYVGYLVFCLSLIYLTYFLPRAAFLESLLIYSVLFALYICFFKWLQRGDVTITYLLAFAVLCRISMFFSVPQLSDDFYRFIWDGQLIAKGIHPYLHLPSGILPELEMEGSVFFVELYHHLNSQNYFSVYPPSNQLLFFLAAFLGKENILVNLMVMRFILLLSEGFAVYLLYRLCTLMGISRQRIILYALNPLVLLEITGNVHFEGVMLVFLLCGIYFFFKGNYAKAGIAYGVSIGIKLTTLLILPVFFVGIRKKAFFLFAGIAVTVFLLTCSPLFIHGGFTNFFASFQLYYGEFEFNASVYYLLRMLGYWVTGYNTIGLLSPALSLMTILIIALLVYFCDLKDKKQFISLMLLSYGIYFLLHTVVHPWYIIVPLGLSVLSQRNFFILWSYLIFFSYSAYQGSEVIESLVWVSLEYILLLSSISVEYCFPWYSNKTKSSIDKINLWRK